MSDEHRQRGVRAMSSSRADIELRLWTVKDVSEYLCVPVGTLYQWRVRHEGPPALRIGKHLRWVPEHVREWARAQDEVA